MFAMALPVGEILQNYGGLCYSFKWKYAGALETLDNVKVLHRSDGIEIVARNMLPSEETYLLKLLDSPGRGATMNGKVYTPKQVAAGIPLRFSARETKRILIKVA